MENSATNNKQKVQDSINLVHKFKNISTNIVLPDGSQINAKYDGFSNKLALNESDKDKMINVLEKLDRVSEEILVQLNISEHNTVIVQEEFKKGAGKLSNPNFQLISNLYMMEMENAFKQGETIKNTEQSPSPRMKP